MHPTELITFFSYQLDHNKKFEYPTRALHQLDLCLPLHFIFFLLQDAAVETCPVSQPFGVEFKTKIPTSLEDYMRNRFRSVLQEIEYDGHGAHPT